MGYIDLNCWESVSLLNGSACGANTGDKLHVGCNFETYLFFELPSAAFCSRLITARLILFKIPMNSDEVHTTPWCNQYRVYPLLDFLNIYGNCYTPPRTDDNLRVDYQDQPCTGYADIDITEIVRAWLNKNPENKGLLLNGAPNAHLLSYASNKFETAGMRPMLRLTYEYFDEPLCAAPCTVKVT
jgi:hypothetical protein